MTLSLRAARLGALALVLSSACQREPAPTLAESGGGEHAAQLESLKAELATLREEAQRETETLRVLEHRVAAMSRGHVMPRLGMESALTETLSCPDEKRVTGFVVTGAPILGSVALICDGDPMEESVGARIGEASTVACAKGPVVGLELNADRAVTWLGLRCRGGVEGEAGVPDSGFPTLLRCGRGENVSGLRVGTNDVGLSAIELVCSERALSTGVAVPGIEGVTRVDDRTVVIALSTWEQLLEDPFRDAWGRPPKLQPAYKAGGIKGFRMLGVMPGSMAMALGFRNGDVIERVNGEVIASPVALKEVLDGVGAGSTLEVEISRRGRAFQMSYRIE